MSEPQWPHLGWVMLAVAGLLFVATISTCGCTGQKIEAERQDQTVVKLQQQVDEQKNSLLTLQENNAEQLAWFAAVKAQLENVQAELNALKITVRDIGDRLNQQISAGRDSWTFNIKDGWVTVMALALLAVTVLGLLYFMRKAGVLTKGLAIVGGEVARAWNGGKPDGPFHAVAGTIIGAASRQMDAAGIPKGPINKALGDAYVDASELK